MSNLQIVARRPSLVVRAVDTSQVVTARAPTIRLRVRLDIVAVSDVPANALTLGGEPLTLGGEYLTLRVTDADS